MTLSKLENLNTDANAAGMPIYCCQLPQVWLLPRNATEVTSDNVLFIALRPRGRLTMLGWGGKERKSSYRKWLTIQ